MKNLSIILLLILSIGCKKEIVNEEPERQLRPASQRYMTHVINNTSAQGVRSTFEVKNLGGNDLQGVFLASYINTVSGAKPWIQVGYHQWGGVSMFSMQFHSTVTGELIQTWPVLTAGNIHSFHIVIRNGWTYVGVDGVDYAKYNHGATSLGTKHITLESVGTENRAQNMPSIRFYPALEIWDGTTWSAAPSAYSSGSGYGVQLNAFNDVTMGSNIKTKPGQTLW